jgi:hypothetical protein
MFCERYPVENARLDFADFHLANVLSSAWMLMTLHRCAQTHGPYFTGEAAPIETNVSPLLGSFMGRPNFYGILIC